MTAPKQNFMDSCLFFNTNAFSRHLLKLAEAAFSDIGLSPAHASLLLLVYETPGISPKDLSRLLQLNPSTVTRFVDALVKKKLVRKVTRGKVAFIHPTAKADALRSRVAEAYKPLYLKYTEILGPETAILLSQQIAGANQKVKDVLADAKTTD